MDRSTTPFMTGQLLRISTALLMVTIGAVAADVSDAGDPRLAVPATVLGKGTKPVLGRKIRAGNVPASIAIQLDGRSVRIGLTPANLFEPGTKVRVHTADGIETLEPPNAYIGAVEGYPNSIVSVVAAQDGLMGAIQIDEESAWSFEPARSNNPRARLSEVLVYRHDQSLGSVDLGDDIDESEAGDRAVAPQALPGIQPPSFLATTRKAFKIKVAVDSGYVTNSAGGSTSTAAARVGSELAFVRMWMQRDLKLAPRVNDVDIFTPSNDPFLPAGDLWTQIKAYRTAHMTATPPNLTAVTHVFYGGPKYPACGWSAGCAVANACGASSISMRIDDNTVFWGSILSAHELAHQFKAKHSNDTTNCGDLATPMMVCVGSGIRNGQECETVIDCCAIQGDCTLQELSAGGVGCAFNSYRPIMWPGTTGGGPNIGEYDGCAKSKVETYVAGLPFDLQNTATTTCMYGVKCGDFDSNGTITSADAQATAILAACTGCAYNGLADVVAPIALTGGITNADSQTILQWAVGGTPGTSCGAY